MARVNEAEHFQKEPWNEQVHEQPAAEHPGFQKVRDIVAKVNAPGPRRPAPDKVVHDAGAEYREEGKAGQ